MSAEKDRINKVAHSHGHISIAKREMKADRHGRNVARSLN